MSSSLAATGPPVAIGLSSQGRPIRVTRIGAASSRLRVLMFGGQHGDEPLAREAVRRFAGECRGSTSATDVQLALIADANPDGAAARTRTNANGIDLNRDHQLLRSPETQALHQFVRRWRPHLIVDVHTYPPRRKHLLEAGLVHCHDVFFDVPTNPAVRLPVTSSEMLAGIQSIAANLNRENYLAARYVLIRRSGRIRHSTPDVIDARNMFALRYGIPTILLEGRQPSRRHDPPAAAARTVRALVRALDLLVEWAIAYRDQCSAPLSTQQPHDAVPIGSRYVAGGCVFRFRFQKEGSSAIQTVAFMDRYTPNVKITDEARLPAAYAVPRDHTTIIRTLCKHGLDFVHGPRRAAVPVCQYRIRTVVPSHRADRSPRKIAIQEEVVDLPLDNYVVFPSEQRGGTLLAVFLEPQSKYGLARLDQLGVEITAGSPYPIVRLDDQCRQCG